jgi:NAD(P)H-flavin reductase
MENRDEPVSITAGPMIPRVARVLRKRRELPDVYTLDLDVPEGTDPFTPGQFNMLGLFGVGEVPISFSGNPAEEGTLVHTIRAVGAVSAALTNVSKGDIVGVRGPFGVGWPVEEAAGQDVVLIAGGLGLAPLRPAFYHVMANRKRYGNVALLYGTRGPQEILFRRELENWRSRLDMDIEVTVDHGTGDWRGHVGVVTKLIAHAAFDPPNTTAFVCGPEIMMRFSVAALRDAGVDANDIHLSMERNMKCAVGLCGHCQFGPVFVCKDGPVFTAGHVGHLMTIKEF